MIYIRDCLTWLCVCVCMYLWLVCVCLWWAVCYLYNAYLRSFMVGVMRSDAGANSRGSRWMRRTLSKPFSYKQKNRKRVSFSSPLQQMQGVRMVISVQVDTCVWWCARACAGGNVFVRVCMCVCTRAVMRMWKNTYASLPTRAISSRMWVRWCGCSVEHVCVYDAVMWMMKYL